MKTLESPRVAILTGGVGSAAPVERAVATLDHRAARDRVPHTWDETEAWVCGAPRPLSWPDGASVAICQRAGYAHYYRLAAGPLISPEPDTRRRSLPHPPRLGCPVPPPTLYGTHGCQL